jgi:hypothetical protein
VNVEAAFPVLLAHKGYISEFIVHGIDPIPTIKQHNYYLLYYLTAILSCPKGRTVVIS